MISPHFFTLDFDCFTAAACRNAAMRLALIFKLLYSNVVEQSLCRCAAIRLAIIISLMYLTVSKMPLAAVPL